MPVNNTIKIRKGSSSTWTSTNPVLASGEPGFDTTNRVLKIGDGTTNWNSLNTINLTSLNITDFNSSVSGVLPVKNLIAGSNITLSSSSGIFTISSSGGSISDPYDLGTYPLITISSQPSNTSVAATQNTSFSITATASSPSTSLSYQWQLSTNSGSSWSNISGATGSTLTLSNVQLSANGYQYRCILSANLSSSTSSSATLTVTGAYSPTAVLLTTGTSYSIPAGATTMKAWAVGAGGGWNSNAGAGGVSYKTWSISGGTVAYTVGLTNTIGNPGGDTTVTYSGTTITGGGGKGSYNGSTGGTFSGGDGGANGGASSQNFGVAQYGGAVGGNSGTIQSCGRRPATDISGLLAAVALAGGKTTEDCGASAAFGSAGATVKMGADYAAGYGGGGGGTLWGDSRSGNGAVVLYFT
jgi:hypothetical protein